MRRRTNVNFNENSNTNNIVIYRKTELSNGLKIITEKVPGVESFALGITIDTGSGNDPENLQGTAHFLEHAVFKRSEKFTSKQISSKFEEFGGYVNAWTTKENTCFYVRALKQHLKKSFELLSEVVFNPKFMEKDIEKEKNVIIEEIKSYNDDLEEMIFDMGDELLFLPDSLGLPVTGTEETVSKINSNILSEFHKEFYQPENIVLSAAGNIDHDLLTALAEKFLNNLKNHNKKIKSNYNFNNNIQRKEIQSATQQAHLLKGTRTDGFKSNEKYTLAVLNVLFGDSMSSRLNQILRERNGLAYSVYSNLQLYADCGAFYIYVGTDKSKIVKTEKLINEEIKKIIENKIPEKELNRAKEQLISSTIMSMESLTTRMQSLARNEFCLGYNEGMDDTIKSIQFVNQTELFNTINKIFNKDKIKTAIILPE